MFGKLFSRNRNVAKPVVKKAVQKSQNYIALKTKSGQILRAYPIGVVDNFYERISVVTLKLRGALQLGELIFIRGKSTKKFQKIVSMQINHKSISKAQLGDEIGIKVAGAAQAGDVIYRCIATS